MFIKNVNQELLTDLRQQMQFKDLTDQQFRLLARDMTYHEAKRGQVLFDQGEPTNRLYLVISGLLQLDELDLDGNEFFHFIGSKQLYPLSVIVGKESEFQATGEALSDLEYITVSLSLYQRFITQNDKMVKSVMTQLTDVMNEYKLNWCDSMTYGTSERILRTLTNLSEQTGEFDADGNLRLPFRTSFIDLAKICGTTRETMSRTISDLVKEGVCVFDHKQLTMIAE
ncbi:Crp/Fnr family transcriptional regulator [Periweissella cryptocerci]|uniref:Crp/Fnr family transcriptional regulator n=1 Tax=Periweissella cryptocerci TaxID=2506420 RepID=A0A4P6YUT9_9LACO|nr:Crp/Fnr family transcriptional regulator [Periweissella cryptocerci]QBO36558.1 Crp/Fnr family transcriptional regulator [Periweissella cryptocerci]